MGKRAKNPSSSLSSAMALTDDAVTEIQLRLPVKSLIRFRCVSKKWCAQINCPIFKKRHLAYLLARYDDDYLVESSEYCTADDLCRNVVSCYEDYPSLLSQLKCAPSLNFSSLGFTSCFYHINGVVCFARFSRKRCSIFLCNPALRELVRLPELPLIPPTFCITYPIQMLAVGIGFDDATDDYVVVKFLYHSGDEDIRCVSYHLRTASWTMIHMPNRVKGYVSNFFNFSPSIFSHGCIHWCVGSQKLILTLNTNTLLFHEILFPMGWTGYGYDEDAHLLQVDSSRIALVGLRNEKELDVWVMEEYGVAESWTKQYSVLDLPSIHKPLSFWKRDKLLLDAANGEIICYDLSRGELYEPPLKLGQGTSRRLPNPDMIALKLGSCCGSLFSIKQS